MPDSVPAVGCLPPVSSPSPPAVPWGHLPNRGLCQNPVPRFPPGPPTRGYSSISEVRGAGPRGLSGLGRLTREHACRPFSGAVTASFAGCTGNPTNSRSGRESPGAAPRGTRRRARLWSPRTLAQAQLVHRHASGSGDLVHLRASWGQGAPTAAWRDGRSQGWPLGERAGGVGAPGKPRGPSFSHSDLEAGARHGSASAFLPPRGSGVCSVVWVKPDREGRALGPAGDSSSRSCRLRCLCWTRLIRAPRAVQR